ncbi:MULTISPECIES: hypothetical protein [unclassified Frigoribacterium]|uniref:hypothetical protein n=1 Tax=unclassified Frigoribacterium TaxID=2627005 RepID=UPI001781A521|nr:MULTISPECIES: hypothetical protein [unclassified Frigoribacterium]MBD8584191.1 hypothetical protein [Frigoribacterium sp. CFBP 8766]MBD8608950.1 hypothetical protein [Frigoribacterium sp. CFBP 13729]MBF4578019.1 hypothetical protein [Frigoribacterium sp. VKM Ac-2530]
MKTLFYAGQELIVTDELAEVLLAAAMEFSDDDRTFRVPVAARLGGVAHMAQLVVGPGIPLLVVDADDDVEPAAGSESSVAFIVELMESLVDDDE